MGSVIRAPWSFGQYIFMKYPRNVRMLPVLKNSLWLFNFCVTPQHGSTIALQKSLYFWWLGTTDISSGTLSHDFFIRPHNSAGSSSPEQASLFLPAWQRLQLRVNGNPQGRLKKCQRWLHLHIRNSSFCTFPAKLIASSFKNMSQSIFRCFTEITGTNGCKLFPYITFKVS